LCPITSNAGRIVVHATVCRITSSQHPATFTPISVAMVRAGLTVRLMRLHFRSSHCPRRHRWSIGALLGTWQHMVVPAVTGWFGRVSDPVLAHK
jgi:hypothetical protein